MLDLEVRWLASQPAPDAPPDTQPRANERWPLNYFWIKSHLPCAVAMLPRATLHDIAGLGRLDAETFAAQVERTQPVTPLYALGLAIPDAQLAVVGLRPARGRRPRFTEIAQLDRDTRTVNRWIVTG